MSKATHVWAIPGKDSVIDEVDPETGLTVVFGKDAAAVQAEDPGAVLMAWDEWQREAVARQRVPWTWERVTEQKYDEMLNVLPPLDFTASGFMVGEAWDHDFATGHPRYAAYKQVGGYCYTASRPLTRKEFRS